MRRVGIMSKSQQNDFIKWAKKHGWSGTKTNGGHIKWTHEKIPVFCFSSSTPSCFRANKNKKAEMSKLMVLHGVEV